MIRIKRQPTHSGKILREDFLLPMELSQTELAEMLKTTFRTVNEILNEKRCISPEMAVRLARFFGTSGELWLNLQDQYDLFKVKRRNRQIWGKLYPTNSSPKLFDLPDKNQYAFREKKRLI
jgi:antitoxin HigA-1